MMRLFFLLMLATIGAASVSTSADLQAKLSDDVSPTARIPVPPGWEKAQRERFRKWRDEPLVEGQWEYAAGNDFSSATFKTPEARPRFTLNCSFETKRITLARNGIIAAEGTRMKIRTETLTRELDTDTPDRSVPETLSYLEADEPVLDAMAASRFAVQLDIFMIVLPASPDMQRAINDCR